MSTHVTSIMTEMKGIVEDVVALISGQSWEELPFVQDLSKNNKRTARYAYGVRPLEAPNAEGNLVGTYMLDHRFEIVLTDTIANRNSDREIEVSLGNLYDVSDEIFKELVNSKVNLPLLVLVVSEPNILQPEIIEAAKIVALRLQLKVKYRSSI